ncbi:hypothetical protein BBP00_00005283 [Phytophthora kernoviae]|uniref:USP domain-containing protein n=1 Tax=Phytophthora kernoviae TaxID=325452 RepID=A0A3F2RPH1_9STRA|nr:hypothetical protein BBP00_00005283 [Phytophthora kernoviae]
MENPSNPRSGEKRGRLLLSGSVCIHFTWTHLSSWKELGRIEATETAAEVAHLQDYILDQKATTDLSSELFRCLSCSFQGVREASKQQLQEIEDGEDDNSFMAHAILHNHVIAVMERKRHLYCASCRDFIYPDTIMGTEFRRRKRQIRKALLRIFTAEEELRGMNQVYCLRCSKYQTNYKRLTLHTIPNVLVFHIRRLDFYRQQKLKQTVRFPLIGLNMKPFTSADNADTTTRKKDSAGYEESDDVYDLVAVVNHHGDSVNGGHYTAFVRDELSKVSTTSSQHTNGTGQHQWILFDDVEVKTVSAAEVEHSQAYLLCYVRRNPFIAVAA